MLLLLHSFTWRGAEADHVSSTHWCMQSLKFAEYWPIHCHLMRPTHTHVHTQTHTHICVYTRPTTHSKTQCTPPPPPPPPPPFLLDPLCSVKSAMWKHTHTHTQIMQASHPRCLTRLAGCSCTASHVEWTHTQPKGCKGWHSSPLPNGCWPTLLTVGVVLYKHHSCTLLTTACFDRGGVGWGVGVGGGCTVVTAWTLALLHLLTSATKPHSSDSGGGGVQTSLHELLQSVDHCLFWQGERGVGGGGGGQGVVQLSLHELLQSVDHCLFWQGLKGGGGKGGCTVVTAWTPALCWPLPVLTGAELGGGGGGGGVVQLSLHELLHSVDHCH